MFVLDQDVHLMQPVKLKEISCAVCNKCWYNPITNMCIYGGPYKGYKIEKYDKKDNK